MYLLMVIVFVIGYLLIALEHPLKIDKAASAVLTGVICWTLLLLGESSILPMSMESHFVNEELLHHLGEIAQILFFLMGAMAIVELIDSHNGFEVITSRITTTNRVKLLWIISIVTFFFSAVLDNLTTAIVMTALLKKLVAKKEDLWFFGGIVVIAANAGGAWSPIGDVTTIMLWNSGQVSAGNIVTHLFLPSIICLIVPLLIITFTKKGNVERPQVIVDEHTDTYQVTLFEQLLIFTLGVLGLLFVPIFKSLTHLPPFMGMLFSLGGLWVVTDIMHRKKPADDKHELSVAGVIRKVDTPSVLFFLGVLLAVASLQTAGHLSQLAQLMDNAFGNIYVINVLIGLLSSIVDNVPLVAGAIGMYPLSTYAQDHTFWKLLAYCAGTGGSALIIGSAAGVAIMGLLKIDFLWYLKKISWLALFGYFAGVLVFSMMHA